MTETPWGEKETSFFYDLTPDLILSAVEEAGYRCTGRCLALNSMENRVFDVEVEVDEESVESKYDRSKVVKFYRPGRWSKEQIQDEHLFLQQLQSDEIPVVVPEVFPDGSTLKKLDDIDIFYTVFPKIGGRNPDEMPDEQLEIVGRLLARLHNVGASSKSEHRIKINEVSYGVNNLRYLVDQNIIPMDLGSAYKKTVEEIIKRSAPLFQLAECQRLHGDCHLGNLLWGNDGAFWVDFDDMVSGPCIQDIWLVCPGREGHGLRQRDTLIDAYKTMRSFDDATLRLVEPLRALRFIHFSAWITKRWKDPAFQRAFPEFNSWGYWSGQLLDLQEQLRWIQRQEDQGI